MYKFQEKNTNQICLSIKGSDCNTNYTIKVYILLSDIDLKKTIM